MARAQAGRVKHALVLRMDHEDERAIWRDRTPTIAVVMVALVSQAAVVRVTRETPGAAGTGRRYGVASLAELEVAMRRVKVAAALLVLGITGSVGTGTASADDDRLRPSPPTGPPGLLLTAADRPPPAETPRTGPINSVDQPPQAENP